MTTRASRALAGRAWTIERGTTLTVVQPARPPARFPWALPGETLGGVAAIVAAVGLWAWFLAATW